MPSAWGHTRLLETDWRFITQESHCFSCGSVKVCTIVGIKLEDFIKEVWPFIVALLVVLLLVTYSEGIALFTFNLFN